MYGKGTYNSVEVITSRNACTVISVTWSGHIRYKKRRLPYKIIKYEKWPHISKKRDSSFIVYGVPRHTI